MAKTRDIKRRIKSIQNTRQLTRAMKMVAGAKLRRSTEQMEQARPYSRKMLSVLRSLASRANPEQHPLLQVRGDRKIELLVVTADKGLCGSFNSNLIRTAANFLKDHGDKELDLHLVGKKGRDYFRRRPHEIHREWIDVLRTVEYTTAQEIARDMIDRYISEDLDAIYFVYNEFTSVISQKPVVERLLPIEQLDLESGETAEDYLYEPEAAALFDRLLPHHVEVQVYHALLESAAAERGLVIPFDHSDGAARFDDPF